MSLLLQRKADIMGIQSPNIGRETCGGGSISTIGVGSGSITLGADENHVLDP